MSMEERSIQRFIELFHRYRITQDFKLNRLMASDAEATQGFLNSLKTYLIMKRQRDTSISLDFLIDFLIEILTESQNGLNKDILGSLITMLPLFQADSRSMCKFSDWLRTSARIQQQQIKGAIDSNINLPSSLLPIEYHSPLLTALHHCILRDNPMHLMFPGEKDSFVQVSSIPWTCKSGYTLGIWIKIPDHVISRGFELFRCRSPQMSIDGTFLGLPEEGLYSVRIVTNSEKLGRDELRGKIYISSGSWHYFAIRHVFSNGDNVSAITVSVDGNIELEGKLNYPMIGSSNETHWTFGLSFTGLISSVTLYEVDLNQNALHFIHSLGCYISDIRQGISCPQSSYDTGHIPLGSLLAKGPWSKLCKVPVAFTLTAVSASSSYSLSQSRSGKQYPDYIHMTATTNDCESPLLASVAGKCEAILWSSWIERLMESGGVLIPLYLFWSYNNTKFTEYSDDGSIKERSLFQKTSKECMLKCINILSSLLKASIDAKEQFIQVHGFHILSHCLSSLSSDDKKYIVDATLINAIINLVTDLGPDGVRGDGIASALQGILFDFRIWGINDLSILKCHLEGISSIALKAGDQFFKSIGVQKLLDVVRVHIIKVFNAITAKAGTSENGESESLAMDCADEISRLLIIAKDAALANAQKSKTNITVETDALLSCLEETSNNLLAERILRLLSNIRFTSPSSLQQSLINFRFHDTVVVSLLMRKGFSLEIRSHALMNLLWLLSYELQPIPLKHLDQRKSMRLSLQTAISLNRGKPSQIDLNRMKTGQLQIAEDSKPIVKAWKNLSMISEVINKSLDEGSWGIIPLISKGLKIKKLSNGHLEQLIDASVQNQGELSSELQNVVLNAVQESQKCIWIVLPLLTPLFPRLNDESIMKVLMIVNVQFKTEETNCEALAVLSDMSWMSLFLGLVLFGIEVTYKEENESSTFSWGTIADIAIETLSLILEYKIRYSISDASGMWEMLHTLIKSTASEPIQNLSSMDQDKFVEMILRRSVSLVIQRLVKTSEDGWNVYMMQSIADILVIVKEKNLHCKMTPVIPSSSTTSSFDLLGIDSNEPQVSNSLSEEETQLLCFILDVLSTIRRLSKKSFFAGTEWSTMKIAFSIVCDSLPYINASISERVSTEIIGYIQKATEDRAPFSSKEFQSLLSSTLFLLRDSILKQDFASPIRLKLEETVFAIIGFFTDLRCKVSMGVRVSPHVEQVLESLRCAESFGDINLVFSVLEVMLKESSPNIISFEDSADDDDKERKISYDFISRQEVNSSRQYLDLSFAELPDMNMDLLDDMEFSSKPTAEIKTPVAAVEPEKKPESADSGSLPLAPASNRSFSNWLAIRQGISNERVDMERARLSRSMNAQDLAADATKKFWRRLRRKVESESFLEAHICQWKLGVAHEGPFFGRKRVVLRPRFDNLYGGFSDGTQLGTGERSAIFSEDPDMSSEELSQVLQKQYSGYIKDVTRDQNEIAVAPNSGERDNQDVLTKIDDSAIEAPGTGWGLIDADGSDEGFGVVGVVKYNSLGNPGSPSDAAEANNEKDSALLNLTEKVQGVDLMSDILIMEDNLKAGKIILETGPCHSGTYRVDSGPAKLDAKVAMITASGNCWGLLSFNGEEIFFRSSQEQDEERKHDNATVHAANTSKMRRRRWKMENVSAIYLRRYRLRDSALEVFFRKGKHRNVFVDFGHTKEDATLRNEFAKALMAAAPPTSFKQVPGMSPYRMVYEHGIQERWLNGKISNFDYLMALNTIAGRSFNDLCQYPVMPWVLSDYSSPTIDLSDPKVFRDLSKPMGALNETRLKEFLDRFYSFEDNVSTGIPAFMYGSHYSTMVGVVLHFLVRLQPFGALHKEMQNGHFDVPDRLFSSIPRSYHHNTNQLSEVKELTPEWFTTPDMFRNINGFEFGETQDNENIDDVELPPWAPTPEDFVRIHRDALESDFVSEHLHEWIDLIFGYKQRGPDAVEAHNVFYYLTYYGSVDHYMIKDETIRKATELQIAHFGQIPMQLFKSAHPAKKMKSVYALPTYVRPLKKAFSSSNIQSLVSPSNDEESIAATAPATLIARKSQTAIIATSILVDRVMTVLDNGVVEVIKYAASDEAKQILLAANNRSSNSANASNGKGKVTSVDSAMAFSAEDFLFPLDNNSTVSRSLGSSPPGNTQISDSSGGSGSGSSGTSSSSSKNDSSATINSVKTALREGDSLFLLEKEYTHFETVPRLPLAKLVSLPKKEKDDKDLSESAYKKKFSLPSMTPTEISASQIIFSKSNKLVFSIGQLDGTIAIRELDLRTGFIKSAGDFYAHKRKVVSISLDATSMEYNIVASCDESGVVLVWTVLNPRASLSNLAGANVNTSADPAKSKSSYAISRRPQRQFRCEPSSNMFCEISWSLGVVVVVSGDRVYMYSIERNELLRTFLLQYSCYQQVSQTNQEKKLLECSCSGPVENLFGSQRFDSSAASKAKGSGGAGAGAGAVNNSNQYFTRRMVISDYGMIVTHVEAFIRIDSLLEYEDEHQNQHLLIAHTISGSQTACIMTLSTVTCLVCPDRGDVVICGHKDGSVVFHRVHDLAVIHKLLPDEFSVPVTLSLPGSKQKLQKDNIQISSSPGSSSSLASSLEDREKPLPPLKRRNSLQSSRQSELNTAVISICVGPNKSTPAIVCITTENGNIYFKALPDFIKWEKSRNPSALQQLASVPLQAVKGKWIQAQNWTAETAEVVAQSARTLADETITKMRKNSIVKGVFSFFGAKPESDGSQNK